MEQQIEVPQQRHPWQPMSQHYEAVLQQWGPSQPVLPWAAQWGPSQSQQVPQPWAGQQHPYFHPPVHIPQQHAEPQFTPDNLPRPCPQPPTATAQAPTPHATSAPPAAADPPHLQSTPRPDDDQVATFNSDEPPKAARPAKNMMTMKFLGAEADNILIWRRNADAFMKDLGRCLARCS